MLKTRHNHRLINLFQTIWCGTPSTPCLHVCLRPPLENRQYEHDTQIQDDWTRRSKSMKQQVSSRYRTADRGKIAPQAASQSLRGNLAEAILAHALKAPKSVFIVRTCTVVKNIQLRWDLFWHWDALAVTIVCRRISLLQATTFFTHLRYFGCLLACTYVPRHIFLVGLHTKACAQRTKSTLSSLCA